MIASYKTLLQNASADFVTQKSRFIGHACPCDSQEQALIFLRDIKAQYKDATHHCFAYVIGENAGIMRYSDDGEPSGTAGMPMMDVLRKKSLVNCCVVVVRYFGGVLLGTGGLVRAYTRGCADAIQAAQIVQMQQSVRFLVEIGYPQWDIVSHKIRTWSVITEQTEFSTAVQTTLLVRENDYEAFLSDLAKWTDGRADTLTLEKVYYPWPIADTGEQTD